MNFILQAGASGHWHYQQQNLSLLIYSSTSPVPTRAGDVLGQVTVEALESLHCGGGEDQDRCHKSQHFHHQSLLGFLNQLHDLLFCSFKSSQTPCFHVVHPTTEVLAIHVFLRNTELWSLFSPECHRRCATTDWLRITLAEAGPTSPLYFHRLL